MPVSDSQPLSVGDLKYLLENGMGGGSFSMTAPRGRTPTRA